MWGYGWLACGWLPSVGAMHVFSDLAAASPVLPAPVLEDPVEARAADCSRLVAAFLRDSLGSSGRPLPRIALVHGCVDCVAKLIGLVGRQGTRRMTDHESEQHVLLLGSDADPLDRGAG
jgi:hypothetical protein